MLDLVALSFLPVDRWRSIIDRLRSGMSPAHVLDEQCTSLPSGRLPPARRRTPERLRQKAALALERAKREQLLAIPWNDARTPPSFAQIIDPPPVLWIRGRLDWRHRPAVAIVGSRAGSAYALAVAEKLGADLAARGIAIVSGLARGVDAAAHRGALSVGGLTVAVLGCGADVVYPAEHRALAAAVALEGALVSEFAPGAQPRPEFFPRRNRIISALSRAIVVVEAGERSGSLITARCALEQNKEVLAVPGNVLNGRNRGGHALLRDGARLVETADDVLEELGFGRSGPGTADEAIPADPLLAALFAGEPLDLEEIAEHSGLPLPALLPRLLDLELRGVVRRAGGGRFVRV